YRPLLDDALAAHFHVAREVFQPTRDWAHHHAAGLAMVHLHWPEGLWRGHEPAAAEQHVDELQATLDICRQLGVRIVWTVHNHRHHDGVSAADEHGYRVLATTADLVVCHSRWSAEWVRSTYGRKGRTIVMPIGSFGAVHPAGRPRAAVAAEVGLDPSRPIVVCAGQLRPYKGLDTAVAACRAAAGAWQLLIVGRPGPFFDLPAFEASIADDADIVCVPEHVSNDRFGELLAAGDAVLLSYSNITGSSVPPAAWAHGVPIIASRLPYFEEVLAARPHLGAMFTEGDAADLARAATTVLSWPAAAVAADTATQDASLQWDVATREYRRICTWWALSHQPLRQSRRVMRLARRLARRVRPSA
ncbi:MAG: glycosyltransferase family 4 protein, partial [Ilumatobacteraceae bacterium]